MPEKSRIEHIIAAITSHATKANYTSAWRLCLSESAKAEVQLISVCESAQNDITKDIAKIRQVDIKGFNTEEYRKKIDRKLGKMVANCDSIARLMVTANILSGKIKYAIDSGNYKNVKFSLSEQDIARVERFTSECVGRIHKGASLSLSSISIMLQRLSVSTNGMSDGASGEGVQQAHEIPVVKLNPKVAYRQTAPTLKELEQIKVNPSLYCKDKIQSNSSVIKSIREEHVKLERGKESLRNEISTELQKTSLEKNRAKTLLLTMMSNVVRNGVTSFVDKGGKRWTLANYAAMSARTASQGSLNFGALFADEAHDLYYIKPHSGSCPLCKRYEGKVYSRSGTNPNYPPLSSAFSKIDPNGPNDIDNTYMSIHPNCRHLVIKYFENNKSTKVNDAMISKSNEPLKLTDKDRKIVMAGKKIDMAWNDASAIMRKRFTTNRE